MKHLLAGATFALTGLLPGATSDTRADLKKAQKDIAQLTVIAYAHQTTLERHERIVKDFKIRINTLEDELADMSNE